MILARLFVVVCTIGLTVACSAPASRGAPASSAADTTPSAATDEGKPAVAGADTAAAKDPLICKTVAATGTRIAQRTCIRRSTLEQDQRNAREGLDAAQRRGTQTGNPTLGN